MAIWLACSTAVPGQGVGQETKKLQEDLLRPTLAEPPKGDKIIAVATNQAPSMRSGAVSISTSAVRQAESTAVLPDEPVPLQEPPPARKTKLPGSDRPAAKAAKEVTPATTSDSIPLKPGKAAEKAVEASPAPAAPTSAVPARVAEPVKTPPLKAGAFRIKTVEVRGDKDLLLHGELGRKMEQAMVNKDLTSAELGAITRDIRNSLMTNFGFIASTVRPDLRADLAAGKAVIDVDAGRVGKRRFLQVDDRKGGAAATNRIPFRARYFSERQLLDRLGAMKEGDFFNYNILYDGLLALNAHPDLTVNTDLMLREDEKTGQRYVDSEFTVKEKLPVHVVLDLSNSGTDIKDDFGDEWRAGVTLQHLNLTKHDDVATLSFPFSLDLSTIRSVAGSYYLPHRIYKGGALTLYGGYSQLEAEEVLPDLSSEGEGWFMGLQGSFLTWATPNHNLTLAPGFAYRSVTDDLILEGTDASLERPIKLTPLSLAILYGSGQADAIGGRNFVTLQTIYNPGDALGGSDEQDFINQRAVAESEYFIERVQLARIQPFAGKKLAGGAREGMWVAFAKADGQYASESLIPADQFAIGGLDSVRGYPDREFLGDDGLTLSLELRTPLYMGLLFRDRPQDIKRAALLDRWQFVGFLEGGYISIKEPLSGDPDSLTIYGTGLGFRLQLTSYSLIRFDYGYPLTDPEDDGFISENFSTSGRFHLSAQVQL